MNNMLKLAAYGVLSVLLLTSCSSKPEGIHVIMFSDMKADLQEKIKDAASGKGAEADIFPVLPEKLLVEITAQEGDLFIVPEEMFHTYDDPENFQLLDELSGEKRGPYTILDQETREKADYAILIEKGEKRLNGCSFRLNRNMVAFIPAYSEKTKEALELITQLKEVR